MKIKTINSYEGKETFIIRNDKFKRFPKNRFIIINIILVFLMIILLGFLLVTIKRQKSRLKKLETKINDNIKNMDENNLLINQQIEAFSSYLNSIKNDTCIYQLLKPKDVLGKKKVRIGNEGDGGYILLNDFANIKIAYSFGIKDEISFDKGLADKNIDIFMYDHTISQLPYTNPKFHWEKIGLTEEKGKYNNFKTLDELLKENGHTIERNMILKIDIEGSEWDIFSNINEDILKQFKYIITELHFNDAIESKYSQVLKKLNKTHQIFHLHCNNCSPIINFDGFNICYAIEISYIIREGYSFLKHSDYFPEKGIDFKNCNITDINHILNIYQIENINKNIY